MIKKILKQARVGSVFFIKASLITEVLFERVLIRTVVVYNGLNLADDEV